MAMLNNYACYFQIPPHALTAMKQIKKAHNKSESKQAKDKKSGFFSHPTFLSVTVFMLKVNVLRW